MSPMVFKIAINLITKPQHPFPWGIYGPLQKIIEKKKGVLPRVHFMVINRSINSETHSLSRKELCTGIDAYIISHVVLFSNEIIIIPTKTKKVDLLCLPI